MGRWIVLLGVVAAVAGCASSPQPAPEMSEDDYGAFAHSHVTLDLCTKNGMISPEIAALGNRYLSSALGSYRYNQNQLRVATHMTYLSTKEVASSDCNVMAAAIMEKKTRN